MNSRQKILLAVVAVEAVAIGGLSIGKSDARALPAIRKVALDPETAREIGRMEEALRPDNAQDWLRLAEICRAFNLLANAEYCYRQADQLSPKDSEHLFDWAATLSRMGETQRAVPILERAIARRVPQADECRLMLARDRLREENPSAAERILRQIKDSPEATIMLARLLIRTGRAREAQSMLDQSLQGAPDELRARQMRSWAQITPRSGTCTSNNFSSM